MAYRMSVDTGGTFTDVVVAPPDGPPVIGKALTTHDRVFAGMRAAIADAGRALGLEVPELLARTGLLIYGTTRATNAIVTGATAKTAFLTTEGFPDTLVLRQGGKLNPHDFSQPYPQPFIPRSATFEIPERIGPEGQILRPLDEAAARAVLERLAARGFEAVAVCLLWSVANPVHERRLGALLAERLPAVPVTLSHQLVPVVREYRRASATAIDASLKPLMQAHLGGLEADLRAEGYQGDILVSTSVGGVMEIAALAAAPIHAVRSGPAMAPLAGIAVAAAEGMGDDVIVCDTGGTTFDIGLVREGRPAMSRDAWLGGAFTGHLLGIAAVDMRSIGAGGGSIAWVDGGGLLRVGPHSAGSEPGPACYGRGGTLPTVSDAAAVLGWLDPAFFLGGRMALDVAAARAALAPVAERIGRGVEATAHAVVTLSTELMLKAIGEMTIFEGIDPAASALVAGGGAAGLNALMIAGALGCRRVVLPRVAAALSAAGMQEADLVTEAGASLPTRTDAFAPAAVNALLARLAAELEAFRSRLATAAGRPHRIEFLAEARYLGQVWELDLPLPVERFTGPGDVASLLEAFHRLHERVFAVRDPASPVEIVNWRARLTVALARPPERAPAIAPVPAPPPAAVRPAWFGGAAPLPTPVHRGLPPGAVVTGPALIEEPTTTLVVPPGLTLGASGLGNYRLGAPA